MRRHSSCFAAPATIAIGCLALWAIDVRAHKAITSKYTYNGDIYPILRDQCGSCHVDGGPAPMSLLSYDKDGGAVAWAASIKEMLLSNAMPPYPADPGSPAVRNRHVLTPRQLDTLLTWTSGGTPRGDLNRMPPISTAAAEWALGKPDVVLPLPEAVTLGPGEMERSVTYSLPTHFPAQTWLRAADLLPQTPAIVRQATIAVDGGPVLAVWEPQHDPMATPDGTAFQISAGAVLRVDVRFRKSWQDEQSTITDRSTVGLYICPPSTSPQPLESVAVDPTKGKQLASARTVTGLRVSVDRPYATVRVVANPPQVRQSSCSNYAARDRNGRDGTGSLHRSLFRMAPVSRSTPLSRKSTLAPSALRCPARSMSHSKRFSAEFDGRRQDGGDVKTLRFMLADDHTVVRQGLRRILQEQPGWRVDAEAANGHEAVQQFLVHAPDVAIVDVNMPLMNGIEATRLIVRRQPSARILILSMHTDDGYVQRAMDAGARGYLFKDASDGDLVRMVNAVAEGEGFLRPTVPEAELADARRHRASGTVSDRYNLLSEREREVMQLVVEGRSSKDVGELLSISPGTVETHRARIMGKLDTHSVAELVLFAVRRGLVG